MESTYTTQVIITQSSEESQFQGISYGVLFPISDLFPVHEVVKKVLLSNHVVRLPLDSDHTVDESIDGLHPDK